MKRSLRHVTRSPFLRVLAAFAWLLLVVLPVHGETMAMHDMTPVVSQPHASHPMDSMSSMSMVSMRGTDHCHHAAPVKRSLHAEDCCGGKHGLTGSCHCAATAGSAMAAVSVIELLPLMPVDTYPSVRNAAAPDVAHGPPLRPPAA
ncbi:hypothetical protein [Rhodanobacter sp. BL-MT-08]